MPQGSESGERDWAIEAHQCAEGGSLSGVAQMHAAPAAAHLAALDQTASQMCRAHAYHLRVRVRVAPASPAPAAHQVNPSTAVQVETLRAAPSFCVATLLVPPWIVAESWAVQVALTVTEGHMIAANRLAQEVSTWTACQAQWAGSVYENGGQRDSRVAYSQSAVLAVAMDGSLVAASVTTCDDPASQAP